MFLVKGLKYIFFIRDNYVLVEESDNEFFV